MHCARHVAALLTSGLATGRTRYAAGEAVTLGLPVGHYQLARRGGGPGHADNLGLRPSADH